MAKLHPAQLILEQMFRQSAPPLRRPWQRELLDAGSQFRGRVHRRHNGQTSAEDNSGVEVAIGGVQEERRPRRIVPFGVRAARMAGILVHPPLFASSRCRWLSTGKRRLLHPRRVSGEPVARCRDEFEHQFALQTATAPGDGGTPSTRPIFHGKAAPTPLDHRIPTHRRFRHPGVRHAVRLLLHSEVAGRPPASEHRGGVRAQPTTDQVPRESTSVVEPADFGHRVPGKQPRTYVAPFATGHHLQLGAATKTTP